MGSDLLFIIVWYLGKLLFCQESRTLIILTGFLLHEVLFTAVVCLTINIEGTGMKVAKWVLITQEKSKPLSKVCHDELHYGVKILEVSVRVNCSCNGMFTEKVVECCWIWPVFILLRWMEDQDQSNHMKGLSVRKFES